MEKTKNKFYITTAIDYPSGKPHIGHAYEKILADTIARWKRRQGFEVFFLTGTDEHGQKIEKYAKAAGKSPQEFVDEMTAEFVKLCRVLNISNDDFIRTTEPRHADVATGILNKVLAQGDIYKGKYEGFYCVDCEAFFLERDLKDGNCPVHGKKADWLEEEEYFFKMSKYAPQVLEYLLSCEEAIFPKTRSSEMINRIKEGVKDLNVSRSNFKWGIPLPNDPEHVIFVWFDALVNYVSALGWPDDAKFKKFWPADIHLIGKDILWFHTMVLMSILLAAGIKLPRSVFVHGFINLDGEKISKSKGVSVDPIALAEKYGTDSLRYFLLREISFGEDGNFSEEALVRRFNTDLANDLGNLVYRTLTMLEKYTSGKIPEYGKKESLPILDLCAGLTAAVDKEMSGYNFSSALAKIWEVINAANKYVEDTKPWVLFKEKQEERLHDFLAVLCRAIDAVGINLEPFMPQTAEKIKAQFAHGQAKKGEPLFPRIEKCS